MKIKILSFSAAAFIGIQSFAQPVFNLADAKKLAGEKKAVALLHKVVNEISIKGGQPLLMSEHFSQILNLSDATVHSNERSIPFSDRFFPIEELSAVTWVPEEKGYKKIKARDIEDYNAINEGLFYDDMKEKRIRFPSVTDESITDLSYTYKISDLHFAFPFYFRAQYAVPVILAEYQLVYPDNMNIRYKLFGDNNGIEFKEEKKGGKTILTWSLRNAKPEKDEDNAPNSSYFSPHVYFFIESYPNATDDAFLTRNTDDLYKHNFKFIKDLNKADAQPEMVKVVDSLRAGITDTTELVRRMYYWVQDHIKYIAFEDGLGGYYPRESNDVFAKRYGDCKDMAALLNFMLKRCGVKTYMSWVGTRDIPYKYEDLPLLGASNHMIVSWKNRGKWEFLDPTSTHLPVGIPSQGIQGKQAMASINPGQFEILPIPSAPSSKNRTVDTLRLELSAEGLIKGKGSWLLDGYLKMQFNYLYENTKGEAREEAIKSTLKRGNNKAKILNYSLSGLEDREKPLRIDYSFEISDYVTSIGDEMFLNLNFSRSLENSAIDTSTRKQAYWLPYNYCDSIVTSVVLPAGYELQRIPESFNYSNNSIHFKSEYSVSGQTVNYFSNLCSEDMEIDKSEFNDWNIGMQKLRAHYKTSLLLKKTGK